MWRCCPRMLLSKLCMLLVLLVLQSREIQGQQPYVNNHQLDCDNKAYDNLTRGFDCNGVQSSCQSYLTFRSNPIYNSAAGIGYLLEAKATQIASINNLTSDVAPIPTDTVLVVPVNCSCSSLYYQYNVTYRLKDKTETYFIIANNTFQGLSTCQAMVSQNKYGVRNLSVGLDLLVPLRCACPTKNQTASGIKYLLTYMVTWGDSISYIADLFGVDQQTVLDANQLSEDEIIFPFTTILVPLNTTPTKIEHSQPSPPTAPAPQTPPASPDESNSSKKWVYVGVGIGAGLLLLVALSGLLFCLHRRTKTKSKPVPVLPPKKFSESADYSALPDNSKSFPSSVSVSSQGFRDAVESLTVYKFQDLQLATENFSEHNKIQGSVYRGSIKGDDAAVKVMKGDVSSEINLLKKINHSNIIRLSGFCLHEGNTYLVYEYADNGAVNDWLHSNKIQTSDTLSWKQRVQIAYDVANALNYLHRYTNPPYIHKNLKTSNILLDANFRAKVANFGLARSVDGHDQGGLQLTRHVVGTYGYLAPEYIENGVITPKLDVFAFGVVILELLSGREAASGDQSSGVELLYSSINRVLEGDNVREKLRGFIDPSLKNAYPLDLAFSIAQLAKICVARDLNARPSMSDVFITLSKIVSSLSDWDPSDELDNSRSLGSSR
ncbi:hypothetical protein Q3G72_032388 [Acer saccharum]|nr:hypothetical protein Q3G72_032388 [Acer saccharum]